MDNKYKYTYEWTANYCYKGTDVLINKLNITNGQDLFDAERELVMLRLYELNDAQLKGDFDLKYLKSIHKYLFQDVYRWAGDLRKCNIAKQDLFCLMEHIETFENDIFNNLKKQKYLINYDNDTKLNKLVELFADINALHPFREGNGRTQRVFIEFLARINGLNLDLSLVSKDDMIVASHESVNNDYSKLKKIFKNNSYLLSEEETTQYIEMYCSNRMKKIISKKTV